MQLAIESGGLRGGQRSVCQLDWLLAEGTVATVKKQLKWTQSNLQKY